MTSSQCVLLVSNNVQQRGVLRHWLESSGYVVAAVDDFIAARVHLDAGAPSLLITDVKLRAYNGLHLIIWSRSRRLSTRSILVGEYDTVLSREAERERAAFLSLPVEERPSSQRWIARCHCFRRLGDRLDTAFA